MPLNPPLGRRALSVQRGYATPRRWSTSAAARLVDPNLRTSPERHIRLQNMAARMPQLLDM
jgi:hypothetical protein